jgi:ABC-type Fe3+ transport system permease subunit
LGAAGDEAGGAADPGRRGRGRRVLSDGYAVPVAVFQNLFGFGLAVLLERDTALNRVVRTLSLIPVLMSALAVGYLFQALFKGTACSPTPPGRSWWSR